MLTGAEIAQLIRGSTVHIQAANGRPGEQVEYFSPDGDRVWRGMHPSGIGRTSYAIQGDQFCYTGPRGACYNLRRTPDGMYAMVQGGRDVDVMVRVVRGDEKRMAELYDSAFPNSGQAPRVRIVGPNGQPMTPAEQAGWAGVLGGFIGSSPSSPSAPADNVTRGQVEYNERMIDRNIRQGGGDGSVHPSQR
jgi:hypothetical protein